MTELIDTFCNFTIPASIASSYFINFPRCNSDLEFSICEGTEYALLQTSEFGDLLRINISDCVIPILANCTVNSILHRISLETGTSLYNRTVSRLVSGNPSPFLIENFVVTDNSNPTRVEVSLELTVNPANLPCTVAFPESFSVSIPEIFLLVSSTNATCGQPMRAVYTGGLERELEINATTLLASMTPDDPPNLFPAGDYYVMNQQPTSAPTTASAPTHPPTIRAVPTTEHIVLFMVLPVLVSFLCLFVVNSSV